MADAKSLPKPSRTSYNSPSSWILFGVAVAAALIPMFVWKELDVCGLIATKVSSSRVASAGDAQYTKNTRSFWQNIEAPRCSVEAGSTEDLAVILGILGTHRTPFAVKGGGHHHLTSTTGVLITMKQFSQIIYDAESQTAVVGAGLLWEDVYAALEVHGVTVIGGRVLGVGVPGLLLGGGYSYLTNQHGLALDNVVAFELVKPNGQTTNVTRESDPELFFGLRGGYSNFGIVTRFTLKTYPQGPVWGGTITYSFDKVAEVTVALAKYSAEFTDPKATAVAMYISTLGTFNVIIILFYDSPEPPAGIFDSFLNIPFISSDVETRKYSSMIASLPTESLAGHRGALSTVPIAHYTPTLLQTIHNETQFWGAKLASKSSYAVAHLPEPFLPNITQVTGYSPSAYPFDRTFGYTPLCIYFTWGDTKYDNDHHDAVKETERRITQAAIDEGQDIISAPKYPNYARFDMPLEAMYGKNLERLRNLKRRVDPDDVMGLAGGFKF